MTVSFYILCGMIGGWGGGGGSRGGHGATLVVILFQFFSSSFFFFFLSFCPHSLATSMGLTLPVAKQRRLHASLSRTRSFRISGCSPRVEVLP